MKASIYLIAPLLLILFHSFCDVANAYDIEQACSKSWGSEGGNYTQCVEMLTANPKTESADKKGLIEIAGKAAIKQIRANVRMYESESLKEDEQYKEAWDICINGHELAEYKMEQVDDAFEAGGENLATIYATAGMDSIVQCINCFKSAELEPKYEEENSIVVHLIDQVSRFITL